MSDPHQYELIVTPGDEDVRLDQFLHRLLPDYSRTYLQQIISQNHVVIDGVKVKASYRVAVGEKVRVFIPDPVPINLEPMNIPLDIIYEDQYLLVINKPAGLVVHPGGGVHDHTLVNAILYHCEDLSAIGGRLRPGIVHRLDKNTSGLLVVAKNDRVHRELSSQFSKKTAYREYLSLVWHIVREETREIVTHLNRSKRDRKLFAVASSGKNAITQLKVEKRFKFLTLIKVLLKTGRTHQIRIHLNFIHHPVFGDPQYHGRLKQLKQLQRQQDRIFAQFLLEIMDRQALHAAKLGFIHPITRAEMVFQSEPPIDFKKVLIELYKPQN